MNKKFLSVILFGALLASTTGTFTSCKDYDDDINGLQEQIDASKKALDEKSSALQSALEAANREIEAAKAAAATAKTAADKAAEVAATAKEAAAQAKVDAIAEAQRLVNELRSTVNNKVDQSVYDAKMSTIDATINAIEGRLDNLEAADVALQTQITALQNFQTSIEALNLTTEFPTLKGQVATLISDLEELEGRVAANETDIATLRSDLSDLSDQIDAVQTGLNTLRDLLSHRLTSLTFAPTHFINGIEVIDFATLQYKPWTKLLADQTDGTKFTSINDGKTQAVYYASPSSVTKADIKKLTILSQAATNTITRAGEQPIITASIAEEIVGGKMIVNLKKNIEGSFNKDANGNVENFTLVALQADIELTEDEIAKGMKPTVISDWARLAETSVTPYIHYTEYENDETVEDLENGKIPHFYPYTIIHDASAVDAVCSTDGKYIIKHLEYTETLDLNTLVNVCDKNGNLYNAETYGLAFEFNLVDYCLRDGSNSEEKTNQKKFAKIDKGVISSCSHDGQANNKDAIGREPMVQVILRNTANNEVVDVRYFKIAWTSERINTDLGTLDIFNGNFVCGEEYEKTVGTAIMNDKVYTVALNNGISKEEFHSLYTLDANVYASLDAAIAGTPAATNLGTIADITAEGSTTTHNLKWTVGTVTITQDEYDAGVATRTVYGRYYRKSDKAQTFTFSLTLTLKIAKMAFVGGYIQTYWNEGAELATTNSDKMFQVNPALTSDANYGIDKLYDCRIIADILKGYNVATGTLSETLDLISNAETAKFVFDEKRVKDVLGNGWIVSDRGLTLSKGDVKAATIWKSHIKLQEDPLPTASAHGTATSAAQELLGKNVPVKLVATNCAGITVELDHFLVNFINPLEMTLKEVTDSFRDLATGGSSIDVTKIATIKEAFGDKRTVWTEGAEKNPALKLVQWYNIEGVTWDLTQATTNLKKNGANIIITENVKASKWSDFQSDYVLKATPNETGAKTLTFHNNSGAHIQQAFQIAVPVYVKTKWAPALADPDRRIVVLTVNP